MAQKANQLHRDVQSIKVKIDFALQSARKINKVSEILSMLLSWHQEFLLENMRRRRPFGHKGKFKVINNFVDNFMIFYESDDWHLASTGGAQQRISFIDLAYHFCPALWWNTSLFVLNDRWMGRRDSCLVYLSSMGIRVETVLCWVQNYAELLS